MSTGKLTEIKVDSAQEALDLITACKPAKADVQQLKSVRDELCNRFREADKIISGPSQYAPSTPTFRRAKKQSEKLTRQITALNNLIKFLETQIK